LFLPIAISDPPSPAPDDSPEVIELKRQLHWAHLKIQVLEERLRLHRIQKYGPVSEKLSDAQLELLEREPSVSHLEVGGERAGALAAAVAPAAAAPASGTAGTAGGSAARGTSDRLRAGAAPVLPLRKADEGDRLRGQ